MSNSLPPIQISLTPRFKKDINQLAKRYRSIRKDLDSVIEKLQAGEVIGDACGWLRLRIAGLSYQVFKVRLKNSDIQKGKSAGCRVIFYLKTDTEIILVTIYSKSDLSDIQNQVIEEIIQMFESDS
jgi:mRNA-degrading endonuclease RelE of RelBE toxin-antitoxin system